LNYHYMMPGFYELLTRRLAYDKLKMNINNQMARCRYVYKYSSNAFLLISIAKFSNAIHNCSRVTMVLL